MGPLILRLDFTVLRQRVQAAVGLSIHAVAPVEGEVVPDGSPRLPGGRLWEAWQRARRRAAERAASDWGHNCGY